jgi:hypothetical protein
MKVKVFFARNVDDLEHKVQIFLDSLTHQETNFHIMDFNLSANDSGWAASLLYMEVPNTQQGEENGRLETEHHGS